MENFLIPAIVVNHTWAYYKVIFLIMEITYLGLANGNLLKFLVSFFWFGDLKEVLTAVNTRYIAESILSEVLTNTAFSASNV